MRAGQRIVIAYRGQEIAEITPIRRTRETFDERIRRLEEQGVVTPARGPMGDLEPLARQPGALARSLAERD